MRADNHYKQYYDALPEKMRENLRKNEKIQKMKLILLGFTEYP